jgi:hypothetical protein
MDAELEVLVVAPPEEMQRAGETTYVVLERAIDLSMSPFIGLRVGLHANLKPGDARLGRYEHLMHKVSNNTTLFEVEAVNFYPKSQFNSARAVLRAKEIAEPTAEKFRAYIELLTTFYGFQRSTDAT